MSRSKKKSKYKSKFDSESESKSDPRQSFLIVVAALVMTFAITALHIVYTKGRSWFLIPYIAVFLAIAVGVAALVWPRSVSAQDAGISIDSGVFVQGSSKDPEFHAKDTAFITFPDGNADDGGTECIPHEIP